MQATTRNPFGFMTATPGARIPAPPGSRTNSNEVPPEAGPVLPVLRETVIQGRVCPTRRLKTFE